MHSVIDGNHDFVSERERRIVLHAPCRPIHRVIEALDIVRFNVRDPFPDRQDWQRSDGLLSDNGQV